MSFISHRRPKDRNRHLAASRTFDYVRKLKSKDGSSLFSTGVSLLLILVTHFSTRSCAFSNLHISKRLRQPVPPLFDQEKKQGPPTLLDEEKEHEASTGGGSIGSLLMQIQKQEEELRSHTGSMTGGTSLAEQAISLDASNVTKSEKKAAGSTSQATASPPLFLSRMDTVTARELDKGVTWMVSTPSSRAELLDAVKILPMPSLYETRESATDTPMMKEQQPLSMPEHYRDRIDRDMKKLGISIASSIEVTDPSTTYDQWRTFCKEANGTHQLLECIREFATEIQKQQQREGLEETFMTACSACRVLRDLCAVSPELSAVITDSILRANTAWSTMSPSTSPQSPKLHHFMIMLKYANEYSEPSPNRKFTSNPLQRIRSKKAARLRCKLYVTQLLLAMTVASDAAVEAIRETDGLPEMIVKCSSYSIGERSRRWLRHPAEVWKRRKRSSNQKSKPVHKTSEFQNTLDGQVLRTSNQVLSSIGYNRFTPRPGQKGLRICCLDGGGARGMVAVSIVKGLVDAMDGSELADSFDIICGTSTGGIISFLTGLRRESGEQAVERYNQLIKQIFVKSPMSTPLLVLTTASYDESHFMKILSEILHDDTMLDSRADTNVPYVFCVASKMSSVPTHVALFRNYNYAGSGLADPFTIDPDQARLDLDLPLELENDVMRKTSYVRNVEASSPDEFEGSRHPGSFRVLQRYALRASTAAPTVFKPVLMGGEMYCDGGIVASNPAALAVHEARALFPDVPIELIVSIGTGGFVETKNTPRFGWDSIIGQIVQSATDGEQIHNVLVDILGDGGNTNLAGSQLSRTRYFRLNPTIGLPDEFPIDVTDQGKLNQLKEIARDYLREPAQQQKLAEIREILQGRPNWRRLLPWT